MACLSIYERVGERSDRRRIAIENYCCRGTLKLRSAADNSAFKISMLLADHYSVSLQQNTAVLRSEEYTHNTAKNQGGRPKTQFAGGCVGLAVLRSGTRVYSGGCNVCCSFTLAGNIDFCIIYHTSTTVRYQVHVD